MLGKISYSLMIIGIAGILLSITLISDYSETIILVVMIFGIVMLSIGAFMKSFINQTRKINEKKDSQLHYFFPFISMICVLVNLWSDLIKIYFICKLCHNTRKRFQQKINDLPIIAFMILDSMDIIPSDDKYCLQLIKFWIKKIQKEFAHGWIHRGTG